VEILLARPEQYRDSDTAAATVKEYHELIYTIESLTAEQEKLNAETERMKREFEEARNSLEL